MESKIRYLAGVPVSEIQKLPLLPGAVADFPGSWCYFPAGHGRAGLLRAAAQDFR